MLKRVLTTPLLMLVLAGQAWPVTGQVLARRDRNVTAGGLQKVSNVAYQPLTEALTRLGTTFGVDLLFEDQTVASLRVPVPTFGRSVETELRRLLVPLGLQFKKVKQNTYLIQSAGGTPERASTASPKAADTSPESLPAATLPTGSPAPPLTSTPTADQLITGLVRDATGQGLPGVNVLLKGTARGTTTDSQGMFRLSVPDNSAVLVFSFVGYQSQEVRVGNQTSVTVELAADEKSLNEVVVVGYGTVKRADLTGSLASVGEQNIKATPVVALDRALQGRAAGVQVTTNSAQPGGSTSIRIRGTGSVNATNEPLYVIDGYPTTTSDLNSINPNDIESVEILKDASATAIYGSRGSNGVVIVTTKRGKSGQSAIALETYYGVQSVRRQIPLLNAREYAEFVNEARINGGGRAYFDGSAADRPLPSALGEGTDWQNAIFRQAPIQSYQLSLSGGEAKTRYAISGNVFNQQGIILNSDFKRYTLRANLDRDVSSRIKLGLSMQGAYTSANSARTETEGGTNAGVTSAALNYLPVFPIYNANGSYFKDQTSLNPFPIDNPVAIANEYRNKLFTTRLLSNVFADVKILDGLTFRTSWGADLLNTRLDNYAGRQLFLSANIGSGSVTADQRINWLTENTLTYNRQIAQRHNLTALVGYTAQGAHFEFATARSANFNDDFGGYNNLGAGATLQSPLSGATDWALVSYLARVNYGYDERFLVTLTARRDGSSRFGPNNKYGFFPSGALAWRISNEAFMRNQKVFSDVKARLSYGLTGNQGIVDYGYLGLINVASYPFGGAGATQRNGGAPSGVSNLDLRWEKNAQLDAGLDVGLLNNRVQLTADYYVKTTSDLLFSVNIPLSSGYPTSLRNIGSVENRGLELALNTTNVNTGGFRWTSEFNIAFNKNKVLTLDGRPEFTAGTGSGSLNVTNPILLRVGEPLGSFYGRIMDGIFQTQAEVDGSAQKTAKPGDIRYRDLNNDGTINDLDRTIIGNGYPKFFGGFNNTFTFKGFELNVFFQGSSGNSILNWTRFEQYSLNGQNQAKEVVNRWTPTNPSNTIPRANSAGGQRILSTFQIEDGSYLRLRNLSLGYNLPEKLLQRVSLRSAKVYVTAQNYLTVTRYKGYDPEVNLNPASSISQGMDYGAYPAAKTLLFGLNLRF